MGKHAYLVISHNKWKQLRFLIDVLDDPRNDFFILIDTKARDFDKDRFLSSFPSSTSDRIFFAKQIDIRWGMYSQIEAELSVLKESTSHSNYDYYHLISGIDMPLKNQNEMHKFFDSMQGTEFVDYDEYNDNKQALERSRYHYVLQTLVGRSQHTPIKYLRDILVFFEKAIGVNRVKEIENDLGKGATWFSITDDFARYVVSQEEFLKKHFNYTYCCDEVFLQTLLNRSPYKKNWFGFKNSEVSYQNLRYLDWGRGKPYTFRKDDFFELCKSPYMFARKFSEDIISDDIKKYLGVKT